MKSFVTDFILTECFRISLPSGSVAVLATNVKVGTPAPACVLTEKSETLVWDQA